MMEEHISSMIKSGFDSNISDIVISVWLYIQEELKSRSKMSGLKELFFNKVLDDGDDYIIVQWEFFRVLIYEEESNDKSHDKCFCLPLTDSNFKMVLKRMILFKIAESYEDISFNPEAFGKVREIVLESF